MNWDKKSKFLVFSLAALFIATGTYNAVVINSDSFINNSHVRFVKRLDESYGVTVQGREIAASVKWHKLSPKKEIAKSVEEVEVISRPSAPVESIPAALVQEQLTLSLVEVINPKKWQKGITSANFSGSLYANNGVIEELSVYLPDGEGVSVSFSEMTGNVFEYDVNGELYSGMMYQVDQHAYMVTLTNGPLEGTRLRFSSQNAADQQLQVQNTLADNNNVQIGNFGEAPLSNPQISNEVEIVNEHTHAQGFNLDQQVI